MIYIWKKKPEIQNTPAAGNLFVGDLLTIISKDKSKAIFGKTLKPFQVVKFEIKEVKVAKRKSTTR